MQHLSGYRVLQHLLFEMRNLVFEIKDATEESLFRGRLTSDEPPMIPRHSIVSAKSGKELKRERQVNNTKIEK